MYKVSFKVKLFNKLTGYKNNLHLRLYSIFDSFVIKNNYSSKDFNHVLIAYMAFGEKFIDALLEFSLPSILQEKNIPSIVGKGYQVIIKIYVKTKHEKDKILKHSTYNKLITFSKVEIICLDEKNILTKYSGYFNLYKYFWSKDSVFKYLALSSAFKLASEENAPLFFVNPDDFYGNGSLSNIVELPKSNKDVLIAQHLRVNWDSALSLIKSKFEADPNCTVNNRELVQIGITHMIEGQKNAIEQNDSFGLNGLHIKKINENTYAVTSSRPCAIFGGISKSDLSFFRKFKNYNYIDYLWPRKLIKDGRAKYVCDSDIFLKLNLLKPQIINQ